MSGRSAYVRKQVKKGHEDEISDNHVEEMIKPHAHTQSDAAATPHAIMREKTLRSRNSVSSDEYAYARARAPPIPDFNVVGSGIVKSSARERMDQMSENVRRGLFGFGKKKDAKLQHKEASRLATPDSLTASIAAAIEEEVSSYIDVNAAPASPTTTVATAVTTNTFGLREIDSLPALALPASLLQRTRNPSLDGSMAESARTTPPVGRLPSLPTMTKLRRWKGFGQPARAWNKLDKDPELWDPLGDTLVFLTHRNNNGPPSQPSFRISSRVLESMDSRYLSELLRENYVGHRRHSMNRISGMTSRSASPTSAHDFNLRKERETSYLDMLSFPTPPQSTSTSGSGESDETVAYELFFPTPPNLIKTDALRYHANTRNIFALLYQASIVGSSLDQALVDLTTRLYACLRDLDCASLLINHVTAKGLDDVRNDPETAISILRWSENKKIRWTEGWREAFVHCVGMFDRIELLPEWTTVSPVSRALIEHANLESQVEISDAEGRLASFDFSDMWPNHPVALESERGCFDRLCVLFMEFYASELDTWPPSKAQDGPWLTREIIFMLQTDFAALYEYLVNREAGWQSVKRRTSDTGDTTYTTADSETIPDPLSLEGILRSFDEHNKYPSIPHPFPLFPTSVPSPTDEHGDTPHRANGTTHDKLHARKVALAYSDSTNIYILGDFPPNRLVETYLRFEKIDQIKILDPYVARKGRWILIYAILQTLAGISVDTTGIKWKEGVPYHLNAKLRRTPPWNGAGTAVDAERHGRSYCWLAPSKWALASEDEEQARPNTFELSPGRGVRCIERIRQDKSNTPNHGHKSVRKDAMHSKRLSSYGPGIERFDLPNGSDFSIKDKSGVDNAESLNVSTLRTRLGNVHLDNNKC